MIYWIMLGAVILLIISTIFTYRDYRNGSADRRVFSKMRAITILIVLMFVIILIADFVVFNPR